MNNPYSMDGREHPPADAAHSWGGFSTAQWEGDMLRIETTHLKEDYIRRDGVPATDEATVTKYWIRRGDILTWVTHHPTTRLYLAEPMIRSSRVPADRQLADAAVPVHARSYERPGQRAWCRTSSPVKTRS